MRTITIAAVAALVSLLVWSSVRSTSSAVADVVARRAGPRPTWTSAPELTANHELRFVPGVERRYIVEATHAV